MYKSFQIKSNYDQLKLDGIIISCENPKGIDTNFSWYDVSIKRDTSNFMISYQIKDIYVLFMTIVGMEKV